MKLEEIGFYTLSDERAKQASASSPLSRCELILTGRCNFRCPYCRSIGGPDMPFECAEEAIRLWAGQGLNAIRFSGGEPTLYPRLAELVEMARGCAIKRIAVSTNGSTPPGIYEELLNAGVNDFSVSLDACCAEDGDRMVGGVKGAFERVVQNIQWLSARVYVTVGVVLTPDNAQAAGRIIEFADSLGVSDVRVIPAAQNGRQLTRIEVDQGILSKHPILRYRVSNIQRGLPVRGLGPDDPSRCGLVLDDMAVCGSDHYPCIIYLREGGKPIGKVSTGMRQERAAWSRSHDCQLDPICKRNCLDVCIEYNRRFWEHRAHQSAERRPVIY